MSKMTPAEWQSVAQLCVVCCVVLKCLLLLSAFITHKVCTVFFYLLLMEWIRHLLICLILGRLLYAGARSQVAQPVIIYSRHDLLDLAPLWKRAGTRPDIPAELLQRRRRGTRQVLKETGGRERESMEGSF